MKSKRKIKDSVFTKLFGDKKYQLKLYKALHPDDTKVTEKDIKTITLQALFVNGIYNDLGLMVHDSIIFLVEAQSTWSENILVRIFLYLAETYKKIIDKEDLYSTKRVFLPKPELYVIYTGTKPIVFKELSLNNLYFNGEGQLDLKVNVITNRSNNDIIDEYIKWSKCSDVNRERYGSNLSAVRATIEECISNNILKDFLEEHKEEIMSISDLLFDQDIVTKNHEDAIRREATQQGVEQGIVSAYVKMYKEKLIKAADAARMLNITVEEFLKIAQ